MRAAWLVMQAGLILGLLELAAAGYRAVQPLRVDDDPDNDLATTVAALRMAAGVVGLLIRGLVLPFLTVATALLALVYPRLRRTIGDGLAWGADDNARERITASVLARMSAPADMPIVLVGHSQGGSISAEIAPRLSATRPVSLVTLGTGHALLSALKLVRSPSGLWRSVAVWFAFVVWVGGVAIGLLIVWAELAPRVVDLVVNLVRYGAALWYADQLPAAATEMARESVEGIVGGLMTQLEQGSDFNPGVSVVGNLGLLVGALAFALFAVDTERVRATVRTNLSGLDIVGTHDPVGSALLVVGAERRLRWVPQTACITLDHNAYFANACVVLPQIVSEIERVAGQLRVNPTWTEPLLRGGLITRRAVRAWLVAGTFLIGAPLLGAVLPLWAFALVFPICVWLGSLLVGWRSRVWVERAAQVTSSDPQRAQVAADLRLRRRSVMWAVFLACAAYPIFGGAALVPYLDGYASPSVDRAAAEDLAIWGLLVGPALLLAAWLTLFGSRNADLLATVALAVTALLWVLHDTTTGIVVGALSCGLATWGLRRLRRFADPVRN